MHIHDTDTLFVYSKLNCPQCEILKSKLKAAGHAFVEVKIDQDSEARSWLIAQGHRAVPQMYRNNRNIKPEELDI